MWQILSLKSWPISRWGGGRWYLLPNHLYSWTWLEKYLVNSTLCLQSTYSTWTCTRIYEENFSILTYFHNYFIQTWLTDTAELVNNKHIPLKMGSIRTSHWYLRVPFHAQNVGQLTWLSGTYPFDVHVAENQQLADYGQDRVPAPMAGTMAILRLSKITIATVRQMNIESHKLFDLSNFELSVQDTSD